MNERGIHPSYESPASYRPLLLESIVLVFEGGLVNGVILCGCEESTILVLEGGVWLVNGISKKHRAAEVALWCAFVWL